MTSNEELLYRMEEQTKHIEEILNINVKRLEDKMDIYQETNFARISRIEEEQVSQWKDISRLKNWRYIVTGAFLIIGAVFWAVWDKVQIK